MEAATADALQGGSLGLLHRLLRSDAGAPAGGGGEGEQPQLPPHGRLVQLAVSAHRTLYPHAQPTAPDSKHTGGSASHCDGMQKHCPALMPSKMDRYMSVQVNAAVWAE